MSSTDARFLAGDIGGTWLRLRMVETRRSHWGVCHEAIWVSRDFESLEQAIQKFLDELSRAERASLCGVWLAVAGPVIDGRVQFTNLPWCVNEKMLSDRLSLPRVHLLNDIEVQAHLLAATDGTSSLVTLQRGRAESGRGLIVAVGTGLGLASWYQSDRVLHVFPSEGGHCDFAPATTWQVELWRWMHARHSHVSYERVISGPGLAALFDFIRQRDVTETSDQRVADRAAEIVRMAESDGDESAFQAIDHFARMLGAFCGNAALHTLATGGIYLTGGVVRNLYPYLRKDTFNRSFHQKGRMTDVLENIPLYAVTMAEPGLEGITRLALLHYAEQG